MVKLEYFFDCSSPWTYLGFVRIQRLAAELGVEIIWRPFLVGGVFNTVNPSVYESREKPVPAKAAYYRKDIQDWARHVGIRIGFPTIFPVNSVKAMRACLVAGDRLVPFAQAVFEAYWGEDCDIADDAVLRELLEKAGLDADKVMGQITEQPVKDHLKDNTQELIERGGFGSPTIFVDGEIFFGQDRLPLVADAIRRRQDEEAAA